MIDYKQAFQDGIDAAIKSGHAREEVNCVFSEFDKEMRLVSHGKIGIARREYKKEKPDFDLYHDTYWAIVAFNPKTPDSPVKQLARWKQDKAGYPCKITFGTTTLNCEDRVALENSLAELIRDPSVGEKIYGIMNLESNQNAKES